MKKRILSLLLCSALMLSLFSRAALAAENGQIEAECICASLCTAESVDEECPVCGAENADLALCEGEAETAVLPNAEAVNHAANSVDVPYLYATGSQQSCSSYTVVDTTTTAWNEGWYVAEGNVTISGAVTLEGDVHLILTDGCSLTVNGGISSKVGGALTIYAQSTGDEMGKLTAIGGQTEGLEGLSAGIYVYNGGITINGGAVNATGGTPTPNPNEGYADTSSGIYAYMSSITVNGGTLTATGGKDIDDSFGIYGQNITVTGGTVTAIGEQAKLSSTGIYVAGLLTVNGGTVYATAGNAKYDSIGIASHRSGSCVINGGVVTAIGNTTNYYSYGIYFFDGNITISDGTVTATAGSTETSSMGICAFLGNITISGGTITATGGTAVATQTGRQQASSIGIYALSGVKISGGTVTATGGAATDEAIGSEAAGSCGICSPQSGVEISGGTITATGGTAPYSLGIRAYSGITVNGGHIIASAEATSKIHSVLGVSLTLPANYWWRTAETDTFTTSDDSDYVYSDTHTYAEITAPACVTFDPNGGVVNPTGAITDIFGRLTSLPTPTRSGSYRFDGWYTAAEGGIMVTAETVFTENATIYAHWSYNGSSGGGGTTRYTVKFETNGGSKVSSKTVKRNTAVSEPTKPTKDGYTFDGWYSDKELKTAYDFTAKVTKSFTLYAKWTEKATEPEKPTEPTEPTEPTAPEWKNPFTDVSKNDWFFESVKYANENGLMGGTTKTTFAPNEPLTRSMLVAILYRADGEPAVNKSIPFSDVKADMYYANATIWAQQNGIVNGVTENDFAPDSNITREQIAAIMFRFAKYKGYDVSVGESTNILSYTDAESISEYAISAMQYAVGSGLMKGKTESTINPLDFATRAEIAAILQRFLEANK